MRGGGGAWTRHCPARREAGECDSVEVRSRRRTAHFDRLWDGKLARHGEQDVEHHTAGRIAPLHGAGAANRSLFAGQRYLFVRGNDSGNAHGQPPGRSGRHGYRRYISRCARTSAVSHRCSGKPAAAGGESSPVLLRRTTTPALGRRALGGGGGRTLGSTLTLELLSHPTETIFIVGAHAPELAALRLAD